MAQKKITDLTLIGSIAGTENLPVDDTIQTYRATVNQLKDFILADGNISRSMLAQGAVARMNYATKTANYTMLITDDVIFGDASGGAIDITLPDPSTCLGRPFFVKKIDTNFVDAVTVKGTIDGGTDHLLQLENQGAIFMSIGTGYKILAEVGERKSQLISAISGSFTAGQIRLARYGKAVTFSVETAITYSATVTATSSAGLIPGWARPNAQVDTLVNMDGSLVQRLSIFANGTVQIVHRNWAGGGTNGTTLANGSIGYNVA